VLIVEDGFAIADPPVRTALGPLVDAVTAALAPPRTVSLSGDGLTDWAAAFRIIQGREAWQSHGAWITTAKPHLGPGVAERFAWSAGITDEEVAQANTLRARVAGDLSRLLGNGDVLCLPTVPRIALLRNSPPELLETFRRRAHGLLCIAGLGGLPQVTLPLGEVDGCPIGLSLIARRGGDETLLAAARRVMALL
jgi:amidase